MLTMLSEWFIVAAAEHLQIKNDIFRIAQNPLHTYNNKVFFSFFFFFYFLWPMWFYEPFRVLMRLDWFAN